MRARRRRAALLPLLPLLPLVSLALALALGPRSAAQDAGASGGIRFQDLSEASGGRVAFGSPRSSLEKSSCAFLDADGDGWDDLVVLAGMGEPHRLLLNRDDGASGRTFVPAPAGHGLDTGACLERDGGTVAAGDVDGDGDEDLFVGSTWNETLGPGTGENVLLLNDGTGRFVEATAAAGLLDGDNTTCAACFFDMDLDGDLDLFTCNTALPEYGKAGDGVAHLWRNELKETGTLRFVDETAARGVVEAGRGVWAATGVDYDGDGDGDLVVAHDLGGRTQLFRNDGTGHFADATDTVGAGAGDDQAVSSFGDDSGFAMGLAWGDTDNDGDLDLYVTNIRENPLYRNNGDGTLTEVGRRARVRADFVTWGCNFEDFDLDGFVDLYVAGGDVWESSREDVRSFLYRNRGDGVFADVSAGAGLRHDVPLHREMGTACADFDGDGRVDLLVARAERAGATPYLYRNESVTTGRRWLTVALRGNGRTTNTSAIGARIRVLPRDAAGKLVRGLEQLREIESGDSRGSQSSLAQTVGLGVRAVTADVVVTWPRAGTLAERTQKYGRLPLDRRIVLSEDLRATTWVIAARDERRIADGSRTEFPCAGEGAPDPVTTLAIVSGPKWVSLDPWSASPTLVAQAPRLAAPRAFRVVIQATAQADGGTRSRQMLTLRVHPAPRLASAVRVGDDGDDRIGVRGEHLHRPGLEFTVDGVPVEVDRMRSRRRRRTVASRAVIALPPGLGAGPHTLAVHDATLGWTSTTPF